jgi:hypothetical protein
MLDLIGAVALGAVSTLVVAVYLYSPWWSGRRRAAAAGSFAAWFALVVGLGATGTFDAVHGTGPAGLGVAVVLPLAVMSYLGVRTGGVREAFGAIPLPVLIAIHTLRLLGVFLVLLFWGGRLPTPFGPAAGWGDVLVGATAIPVAYMAATRAPAWRSVTLVWNALGLLDLADAIALGVASSPGIPFGFGHQAASSNLMTMLPWILIPCFNVPLLAHLHVLIFQRLWPRRKAGTQLHHVPRHST